jgi:uncharacterized protein involved in outer membrane biogenesis
MSGWRSPLLALGVLLVAVAAAALLVPPFIDWTRWRGDIERYGERFTGREVRVDGAITVRVFPWPVVALEDVRIANPPGAQTADLARAGRIEARLALAALISGRVEVEAISVEKPVFGLERLAAGGATWHLSPRLELTDYVSADRVAVAGITLDQGTVFIGDGRRGGLAQLDDVTMELSAPSLAGPWRLRGRASYRGQPIEISVNTGRYRDGEPLKLALRVAPVEESGIVYAFDGEVGGERADTITGTLKLAPAQTSSGKADAEIDFKPLVFRSEIAVRGDTVTFDKIEVTPVRALDAANLLSGKAVVKLGAAITVDATLAAAKLDIDAVTGARGREILYSPASLDLLAAAQGLLPDNVSGRVALEVNSLIAGGETLDGAKLDATVSRQQLTIRRLETLLAGQTKFAFSGSLIVGEHGPQLIGDVDVDSLAIRDLVMWAAPDKARGIGEVWSGARGRLVLQAKADIAATALRLSDVTADLDGTRLAGSLRLAGGLTPSLAIRFDADRLDLDRYAPDGLAAASEERDPLLASVDLLARSMGFGDFHLSARAGRLRLNGVEAEDVAIDMGANEEGIEFRTFDVGNIAGARLDMTGLLRFPEEAIAGSLNAKLAASDPAGLLRLLGLADREDGPTFYDRLAATSPLDIEVVGEATADDDQTTASLEAKGVAGNARFTLKGRFAGNTQRWQEAEVHASGEVADPSSKAVLALLGFAGRTEEDAAASFTFSTTGSYARGLATTFEAAAYGARSQFVGTLAEGKAGPRLEGRLAMLAERAEQLYRALGLPAGELSPMARVLSGEGAFSAEDGRLALEDLNGTLAGISYSGRAGLDLGAVPRLDLTLEVGRLSVPWLFDAIFLPRDGAVHDITTRFPDKLEIPGEVAANLQVGIVDLMPGLTLDQASVTITGSPASLALEAKGKSGGEDELSLSLTATPGEAGLKVAGEVSGQLPLGRLFQESDGTPVLSGTGDIGLRFEGEGRSPQGLVAAGTANGTYRLTEGVVGRLSPANFARDLAAAKTPQDVDRLIRSSLTATDMSFTGGEGTLVLASGVLTASPLPIKAAGAEGEIRLVFEPAEGAVDIAVALTLDEPRGTPAFEIAYAGHPFALERSSDTQALKSHLAVKVLKESIDQLEELQRRERELIEEEEQFKREEEAKEEARREIGRRAREVEAWRRLREQAEGARSQLEAEGKDALLSPDNVLRSEATDVPLPKFKPPQPDEKSTTVAEEPRPIIVPPLPNERTVVPQSLFQTGNEPVVLQPHLATPPRLPARER